MSPGWTTRSVTTEGVLITFIIFCDKHQLTPFLYTEHSCVLHSESQLEISYICFCYMSFNEAEYFVSLYRCIV